MKRGTAFFKAVICASLVLSIIFSMVGCAPEEKKNESSSQIPSVLSEASSKEESSAAEESSSEYEDIASIPENETSEIPFDEIPWPEDDIIPDPEDEEFDEEPWEEEFLPEDDLSYGKYDNPIQCYGDAVKGRVRNINVELDEVAFEDFYGFGTNSMTNALAEQEKIYYNEAFFEFDMNHEKMLSPQVIRLCFMLDYMVTNEEPDPLRRDVENNKDFQNYMNGIYDFESPEMKSMYAYLDKYKEMGSEIMLNFGWKTNGRITNWYALPVFLPTASAPYDLKAYAKACVALYENFQKRGYDNVKYIGFFNEPQNSEDFLTVGDSITWFAKMVDHMDKEFKNAGHRDEIELWGPEQGQTTLIYHDYVRDFAATKGVSKDIDRLSIHRYYKGKEVFKNNYYEYFNDMIIFRNEFGKDICCTEMEAYAGPGQMCQETVYTDWNDTYSSYIIASLNTGVKAVCAWGLGEYYWSQPLNGWMGYGHMYKHTESSVTEVKPIGQGYDEIGLITNYVTPHCDVLSVDWQGDDIRVSALRLNDGNYTILVETMGGDPGYDIKINFSEAIGKTFYRFETNRIEEVGEEYTIPSPTKIIENVGNTLSDSLDGKDASLFVYTTKKPIKQISINDYSNFVLATEELELTATLIDCEDEELVWSVSASSGEKGEIQKTGEFTAKYIPSANAKAGDIVAVRAALKSNPNIYMTALIEIQ